MFEQSLFVEFEVKMLCLTADPQKENNGNLVRIAMYKVVRLICTRRPLNVLG